MYDGSFPPDPRDLHGREIVLKLGTQAQASSDWIGYLDRVNTRLGELSGGTMRIEIALGGQLGSNAEHWAQMNAGTLDLFAQGCDAPSVAPGGKDFDIVNLPFLFDDVDHWHRFLKSDIFAEMNAKFSEKTDVVYVGHLADIAAACPDYRQGSGSQRCRYQGSGHPCSGFCAADSGLGRLRR